MEFARGGPIDRDHRFHADSCSDCAQFVENQIALSVAASILADEEAVAAPLGLEAAVMAEFDFVQRRRSVLRWRWASVAAGAVAASMILAWFIGSNPPAKQKTVGVEIAKHVPAAPAPVVTIPSSPVKKARRRRPKPPVSARSAEPDAPFVQVPFTLPLAPYERASVMRVELPVSALIAAGVPVATANTGGRARADVVIGEDGRARAFRVISISAVDSRSIN